jgi:hypothetical protein
MCLISRRVRLKHTSRPSVKILEDDMAMVLMPQSQHCSSITCVHRRVLKYARNKIKVSYTCACMVWQMLLTSCVRARMLAGHARACRTVGPRRRCTACSQTSLHCSLLIATLKDMTKLYNAELYTACTCPCRPLAHRDSLGWHPRGGLSIIADIFAAREKKRYSGGQGGGGVETATNESGSITGKAQIAHCMARESLY